MRNFKTVVNCTDELNDWASAQEIPELELLASLQDDNDTIWVLPVPRNNKAGLFLAFDPISDMKFLNALSEQNYSVVICRRLDGAKNAILRYLS